MRRFAFWIALLGFVGVAHAQPAETTTPLNEIYACASITDDAARLQCFDDKVGRLRSAEQSGQVVAVDRQQVDTLERQSFGFQLPALSSLLPRRDGEREQIERVEAHVSRIIPIADGRHIFVLDNDQRWSQIQAQSVSNVEVGDAIAIRRAALGSFMLSPVHGAAHRVRRVE